MEQVAVTLIGGPLNGQIINCFTLPGGVMPRSFLGSDPANVDGVGNFYTYIRDGGPAATRYVYWADVVRPSITDAR
jgi:hypothetical protein